MRDVSGGARRLASIVGGFRWDGVRRCNSTGGEDTPHLRSLKHRAAMHTTGIRRSPPGRATVKVIDIFGNDTMTLVPVHVG
jgi:hypothetical protein